mgnify:FL=1
MTNKQIATTLNTVIMKNEIVGSGWTQQIAEDLSNIVEFGKSLTNVTKENLLNFKQNLVAQISNDYVIRKLEKKFFGLSKSRSDFRVALQRIMSAGLIEATDSHMNNLSWSNGKDWHDGKYYGADLDSTIYTDTVNFKIPYSLSENEWNEAFESAEQITMLFSLIATNVESSITSKMNALSKRLLVAIIDNCEKATTPRRVKLVTEFNNIYNAGGDPLTFDSIVKDRILHAKFNAFVKATINELRGYTSEPNYIYNDGSVVTWTPKEKIKCVLLNKFTSDIEYITDPIDYHEKDMPVSYETINGWQTTGKDIFKTYEDVATIVIDGEASDTTYSNVVGVIFDIDGAGMEIIQNKVTKEYVGSEDFTNYFHHMSIRNFVDTRLSSIVLELT